MPAGGVPTCGTPPVVVSTPGRTSRKKPVFVSSPIVRTSSYGKLQEGDRVIVLDEDGRKVARVKYEFRCHAVNTDTGAEWLELYGGRSGHATSRAFKAERVLPFSNKRRSSRTS